MIKITKKDFAKNLAKYGAFSVAIAGIADASGQIVYTDIDDLVIGVGGLGDAFELDLNDDGTPDVSLDQFEFGGNPLIQANADITPGNGIATFESLGYNYASNLAAGTLVDSNLSFNTGGTMNYASCAYAAQQWCGTITDGYLGIEFTVGADTHFGWIRLDADGPNSMTLKDYAFDATPGTPIEVGDMGATAGVNDQAFVNFDFFVSNEQLNLSASNAMSNVTVYTILGQQVADQKLSGTNETVNIAALSTGVYVAKVSIDGAVKTIKFAKK